jgi:uncharacterized damage-inducible protein DinB
MLRKRNRGEYTLETNDEFGQAYVEWCRYRLMNHYWPRIERCLQLLSEADTWWRQHETNNSVGNLLMHLTGNLGQFVLAAIDGQADARDKDKEFSERAAIPKAILVRNLRQALAAADEALQRLDSSRLVEMTIVQGRERRVFEVLAVVVEHFALHTGQIIYITKLKCGLDVKF